MLGLDTEGGEVGCELPGEPYASTGSGPPIDLGAHRPGEGARVFGLENEELDVVAIGSALDRGDSEVRAGAILRRDPP